MKKVFRIISNVLMVLMVAAVLILVVPRLFGVKMFGVLSGSMEPAYSVGDLIYAVPTDAGKIEEGDVISFLLNDDGTVATHRVVEIDRENKQVYTKGDANELSDGRPVSYENILGVVKFSIPVVGRLIVYMNTTPGKIITITIILALILLILLLQREGDQEMEEDDPMEYIPKPKPRRHKKQVKHNPMRRNMSDDYDEELNEGGHKSQKTRIQENRSQKAQRPQQEKRLKKEENSKSSNKSHIPEDKQHIRFSDNYEQERKTSKAIRPETVDNSHHIKDSARLKPEVNKYPDVSAHVMPDRIPSEYRDERETSGDYQYEKLQVCWKMLTLMERMWDETISSDAAFSKGRKPQSYRDPVADLAFDWQDEEEKGGESYVPGAIPAETRHEVS